PATATTAPAAAATARRWPCWRLRWSIDICRFIRDRDTIVCLVSTQPTELPSFAAGLILRLGRRGEQRLHRLADAAQGRALAGWALPTIFSSYLAMVGGAHPT